MVLIFALLAAHPLFICAGDRICIAANELRGHYAAWGAVVNRIPPGGIDAREPRLWKEVEKAFKRLRKARETL
jgi:hypothetical protein